jgi:tetratricopeptide (TPR) repeat protein
MNSAAKRPHDEIIGEVERLSSERRYDEALSCLDRFIDDHRASPELPDLKRTFAARRASLLSQAGRFADALAAWNERAFLGLRYSSDAYEVALGRSICHIGMGAPREAIKILEVTLDRADPAHLTTIQTLIEKLTEAYTTLNEPLPQRWRKMATRIRTTLNRITERQRPEFSLKSLAKPGARSAESP